MINSCRKSCRSLSRMAAILLGLVSFASFGSAQQSTEWQLNAPYRCPDGRSYTITRRAGTGPRETCWYKFELNGQHIPDRDGVIHCAQMAGMLKGCSVESANQSQPAAQPAAPVEDWHSRPTNPAYLAAMPYVEKVKSTIQGTSPDDTLARQVTVFTYLREMITRMREASRPYGSPWTPDETRIDYDYYLARKQISDAYTKTHTKEETVRLQNLEGHYQFMDDQFYRQWTKALFPADFLAAYDKAAWGLLAQYNAHVDQERKQAEAQIARQKAAQQQAAAQGGTGELPNNANSVAARRCLELGGTQLQCFGKALSNSFFSLFGMEQSDLFPTSHYTGITLTGIYESADGISAAFNDTTVGFGNCGNLIIDSRHYTMVRNGNQIVIHVDSAPKAFSFLLEPDGRLVGPPSAVFNGKVVTGYHHYWAYKYNKRTGQYVPGSGHEVTEPIYAAKTDSCTVGSLNPAGSMSSDPGVLTDIAGAIGAITGQASSSADKVQTEMPPPGIRMAGVYASQGGLKAGFATASVVLDCGEAHARDKYTVERAGSQILVHVQNPASPFTATVQPDGSLSGPASVAVAGRIATGMTGDQVNYVPRNASCSAGKLFPSGAAAQTSSASATTPSEPAPANESPVTAGVAGHAVSTSASGSAGDAALSVASGFPAGANLLAGRQIFLMKQRMDDLARNLGLHPPAGITACQTWADIGAACRPATKCTALLSQIGKNVAARLTMPAKGQGAFPSGIPLGTYYVMTMAKVNDGAMCWNVRTELKPGANSLTLDARNGELLK